MKSSKWMCLLMLFASTTFGQKPFEKTFPAIDSYIDSIMKDWNLPGLALGIVYKDRVIYSKGYGYRDLAQKLPVQTTTLFPIASNTKLFTATLAAILAVEGKLSLDKPARNYMPSLLFYNDELNAKVTLRDMLSHRVGLPTYNAIWVGTNTTRREAISKVVYMKPQLGFREGFIYNNMMYAAAGVVMEALTNKKWEDLMREKLLMPLKMNASVFTNDDMTKYGNYSLAYVEDDSNRKLSPKKFEAQSDALGPAGTLKSTVEDMSHWMIAQLNGGRYNGNSVIPGDAIKQTMIPNAISDREGRFDELSNSLYALGRIIQTYKGYKIASHTGSIDGFYSSLLFIPGQELGIYMVHNGEAGGNIRSVMALPVVDRLLGLSHTPWSQRFSYDFASGRAGDKRITDSIKATQVKGTTTSHPLSAFTGTYVSQLYGDIKIDSVNNALSMSFRKISSPLTHWHYDQFVTKEVDIDIPKFRLHFLTNDKGDIDRISTRVFGDPTEVFIKK